MTEKRRFGFKGFRARKRGTLRENPISLPPFVLPILNSGVLFRDGKRPNNSGKFKNETPEGVLTSFNGFLVLCVVLVETFKHVSIWFHRFLCSSPDLSPSLVGLLEGSCHLGS